MREGLYTYIAIPRIQFDNPGMPHKINSIAQNCFLEGQKVLVKPPFNRKKTIWLCGSRTQDRSKLSTRDSHSTSAPPRNTTLILVWQEVHTKYR